jgi:hypothetical protein
MDRKILTIILAIALIAAFFLDYSKGGASGYESVFSTPGGSDHWHKYIWLLIPLSGLMLLIGAVNNSNYPLGRSLWAWLPLLVIIFFMIKLYLDTKSFDAITESFKYYGIGMWITLGASLILALYRGRR